MSLAISTVRGERDEWLAWRQQGIGGSDAAAICGLSPWSSPMSVWLQKTGQLPPGEETERMGWGNLLENVVADEFERRTGLVVTDRQRLATHPEHLWMRATLDGLVCADPNANPIGLYEGKTSAWASDWSEGPPIHVQIQCQHNLAVTGLDVAYVAVLLNGNELRWWEVARDDAAIEELIALEQTFWRLVQDHIPPAVDGRPETIEALKSAYAEPDPGTVADLPADALDWIRVRADAKATEKAAKEAAKEAEAHLMAALGEKEVGQVDGRTVVTWKRIKDTTFDIDGLRDAHPEVAEEFTRESSYRRFNFPKPKEEKS